MASSLDGLFAAIKAALTPRDAPQEAVPVFGGVMPGYKPPPMWKPNMMDVRQDGTLKDTGWYGVLNLPNGGVASEFSVPIGEGLSDEEIKRLNIPKGDMPTLANLTPQQLELMRTDIIPNSKPVPMDILERARSHALDRIKAGKSPFFDSTKDKR